MATKRTTVVIHHDTGYGDDLILHLNNTLRGKDMMAVGIIENPTSEKIEGVPIDSYPEYICSKIGKVKKGWSYIAPDGVLTKWNKDKESDYDYPIVHKIEKPKQFRPFANSEEFKPHRDRWVREKTTDFWFKCHSGGVGVLVEFHNLYTFKEAFDLFVFDDDNTPFGVEVT